jgi:hypothetical protein
MTSARLLLALVGTTAHAVREGTTVALCGSSITTVPIVPFPGGASSVCRACSREAVAGASTVPLRGLGGRKRPGGM